MRKQIPLLLEHALRYSAEHFHLHAGIKGVCKAIAGATRSTKHSLMLVLGAPLSGKTHLAVYAAEVASTTGRETHFFEGSELLQWIAANPHENPYEGAVSHNSAFIVDDTDRLFQHIWQRGTSALLVDFIERCKAQQALLIFFVPKAITNYNLDSHVLSQLRGAAEYEIGAPHLSDIDPLLDLIARQRGVLLTPFKRTFLTKRITQGIPEIVECLSRLTETTASERKSSTSLTRLAEVFPPPPQTE